MDKLKSIIIDDEQHCIDTLKWQIEKYSNKVEVLQVFDSAIEATKYLKNKKVDLIFLDIEMPEMNGFEFLKQYKTMDFDVVFTTAYDDFAVKAFKASAIDYLLKPIDENELIAAIEKAVEKQNKSIHPNQMEILYDGINQKKLHKARIAVPTNEGLHFIKIKDILYCISDSNYTNIHLVNNKRILVSRTLKEIEAILTDDDFLRVHHSNLINLKMIERYIRGDGGSVIMDDGKELSVSRSKKDTLLKMFGI